MLHRLSFWLGLALAFPVAVLLVQTLAVDLSWSGRLYTFGLALLVAGLLTLPLRRQRPRRLPIARLGAGLLCATFLLRTATANGERPVDDRRARPSPADWPPSWLLEERDLVLAGGRVLQGSGHLPRQETAGLVAALAAAYDEIAAGAGPRPQRITLPATRRTASVPALLVPTRAATGAVGVVFLHGYAGNFTWPCWAVAQAAQAADATTLCPTLGFEGDWWSARGERVARQSIAWLRAQGASEIYLAGLSNGAAGVAALSPRLRGELAGIILLSGTRSGAGRAELPTLIVQGSRDTMMRTSSVRRFAQARGAEVSYRELAGGHFVMLHSWPEVRSIIAGWLRTRR